jgi:hypothetical protein
MFLTLYTPDTLLGGRRTEVEGSTVTGAKQGTTTVVSETTRNIDKIKRHSSASTSVADTLEDSPAVATTEAIPNELIPPSNSS